MPCRARNDRLRRLVTAAAWTYGGLARAVNAAGAEAGLRLSYDRTAVAHWMSGSRPRGQVPALITEVLSRRLGFLVTLDDIGLAPADAEPAGPGHGDGLTALADLTRTDLDPLGHDRLSRSVYRLDALLLPAWSESPPEARGRLQPGNARAPRAVTVAEHLVGMFAATNRQFGGGHARTALTAYLAHDVLPKLADAAPEIAHRDLLGTATDLTLLIGFACFDSNEHGLAQRYYRVALDLAALGGDPVRYAIVVRALSQQACHLEHRLQALGLALAALTTGDGLAQPHTGAFLHAQVSLSYAALGRRNAALSHYRFARNSLVQAIGPSPIFGAYHRGELAYHAAVIRTCDGDTAGAIAALYTALRHYPAVELRSRVLVLADLAERQLDLGALTRACATAHRFLDDYPRVRSARVTTAMHKLRTRFQQFRGDRDARDLLQRLAPQRY